jgi:hypothetical protein
MLSVTCKPFMLSVIMLRVVMLNVVMISVIMLIVVAPLRGYYPIGQQAQPYSQI